MAGGCNTSTYLQQNGSSAQRVACVIHFGGDLGRISRERPGCACGLGPLRGRSWAPCRPGRFWGPGHGARRPGRVPPPVRSAGLLRYARPWPPSAPLGRCGPCPAALPPPRAPLPAWAPGPLRGRWPWLGPLRSLGVAPGSLRPIGGPPAPVGGAGVLPRGAPLRRGRFRPPAALARRGLGPLLGGSGPGGSCRLPPPGGGAALLPPPGLRPLPRRPGSPSPRPCRAARLTPWAAPPPPSGGGWGAAAPPLCPAAAPSVGG